MKAVCLFIRGVDRILSIFTVIILMHAIGARPVDKDNLVDQDGSWQYLVQHGYVSKDISLLSPTPNVANAAIKKLPADIDEDITDTSDLSELIKAPRCSKINDDLTLKRRKRFVAHVTKWDHRDLYWSFRDPFGIFQNRSDFELAKETMARAFSMWSFASKNALRFIEYQENSTRLDIDVFFAIGNHGDHEPFDGRGGIVAHSGYPPEGKIHFDASEMWMINGDSGIDLRYVMLHETGHALGLRHSKHRNAIMHPIYRTKTREIALTDDDIKGIRYLYPNGSNRHNAKKVASIDFEEDYP